VLARQPAWLAPILAVAVASLSPCLQGCQADKGYGDTMTGGQLFGRDTGEAGQPASMPPDPHYTAPLYRKAEAARIIDVPPSTLRNWAGRPSAGYEGLITVAQPATPRGPTVPFVGLTEAYVLASFRQAGVPMQRIRPAVRRLEEEIGLAQALASERLRTDGAEVLWDYGQRSGDQAEKDAVGDLVVVRNGQMVFRPVVRDYLQRVTYRDGWAKVINIGRGKLDVTVDPWINGGQPTLARRGIAVTDILSRIRAGETSTSVAADYDLRVSEITALLELAA
jgi:uncharacterized protein (DUF433 family)